MLIFLNVAFETTYIHKSVILSVHRISLNFVFGSNSTDHIDELQIFCCMARLDLVETAILNSIL